MASSVKMGSTGFQEQMGLYFGFRLIVFFVSMDQLCDSMIFNHDQPRCFGCLDCGGPSHCGMACSALVVNKIEGYPVCSSIGYISSMTIDVVDKKNPHTGVSIRMSNIGSQLNCSLTVSVLCDLDGLQGPDRLETVGTCGYVTSLRHPSGCAKIISIKGNGFGWFGSLMIIIVCVFGAYLLAGIVYRSYFLRIRGINVIPNLEFWGSLPHRIQGLFTYVLQKYRGHTESYTSSYSPVDF
ncbi:uncharacterized protein LOC124927890 isoform X2 [Impatiens glandulifera]|uniref:uncharacterized protein LOC124927890 isoform X2 n=1 Tax=Impatiens glandulifera TaxID=253017 RepID=UPI001FB05676|nr:uncharacterized protein LOC124927890 isoform X2 [Impatiens glandulifera]